MKQETKNSVRVLLHESRLDEAERMLHGAMLEAGRDDEVYLWMGHLNRQRNDWKQALECYAHAIDLNPQSEALMARQMLLDIINFRDVQSYNV